MHVTREPSILYFGTPVVLISTVNEDGTYNLAPMSSVFWLGWHGVLGLERTSKTTQNLLRTGECVLNLPSSDGDHVTAVNRLALTTGANPVPDGKVPRGYRHVKDKFGISGLTPNISATVVPPRVNECPVQLEAVVEHVRNLAESDKGARIFEVRIVRVHVAESLLVPGKPNHIDPDQWQPLIMSFQQFYGLTGKRIHESRLASIPEHLYRSPDMDRARGQPTTDHRDREAS